MAFVYLCLAFFSLFFFSFLADVKADRTSLKIYENIQGDIFCFRRLNATHQIGCSSYRGGNIGVVHIIEQYADIEDIVVSPPYSAYIVVLPMVFFNMGNMTLLKQAKGIQGILILKEKTNPPPDYFSPEQSCPNRNFGLYNKAHPEYAFCKKMEWNDLPGNLALGMMYEDWGMPLFVITNDTSIKYIRECYVNFNKPENGTTRKWPLCSAQLKSVMLAAKDSETCMRRSKLVANLNQVKTCDPLHDKNVITTLFPTNKAEEISNQSVVVVAARLDAFSMFDRLAPGAHSTVTGLVTLLAIAKTISSFREEILENMDYKKNILFIIFNGEAFDYIGSSRVVYDMQKDVFPLKLNNHIEDQPALLNLNHISHFIELSQLAPENAQYWVHTDPVSMENASTAQKVNDMVAILQNAVKYIDRNITIKKALPDLPLPPASFQNFLKHDLTIPGIVIADHETKFINRYYNSIFDNNDTVDASMLTGTLSDLSAVVSRALFEILTSKKPKEDLKPDESLISGLLECYLQNASCDLFREIAYPSMTERLRVEPYPLYVSVDAGGHTKANAITLYTRYLLAYLTGDVLENYTKQNCSNSPQDQVYQYDWMAGPDSNATGICVKSTVMYTLALSPAYELNDWKSTEYSTWTESVWLETSVRIFLQPSKTQEAATLITGVAIFFFSTVFVYFVNVRSSIIFNTKPLIGC